MPRGETDAGFTPGWVMTLEGILESFVARLVLSVAIIVSLLPTAYVDRFDVAFLALFGTEFLFRLLVILKTREGDDGDPVVQRRRRVGAYALLFIDLIALVSFAPLPDDVEGTRWLRLFRLSRMLLLVGYWAPLVRDLWSILARRERARQIVLMGFVVAALSFGGAVVLHQLGGGGVDYNGDGRVGPRDTGFVNQLWWAFRQVQDPGNMLASPTGPEAVVVSVGLTVFGLFLVSFLIGLGSDVVRELLQLSRLRPPGLRGHTVLVNVGAASHRLLQELMGYYQKLRPADAEPGSSVWWHRLLFDRAGIVGPRYVVSGEPEDPPDFLRRPELGKVIYRQRPEEEDEFLARVDARAARRILLLADLHADDPDTRTVETLFSVVEAFRVRRLPQDRLVIAEVLDEGNVSAARSALEAAPGIRGFVVPTEKIAGLFLSAVARRAGLGTVLEELMSSRGHEMYTCFFDMKGLSFRTERPPLPDEPGAAMDTLLRRGLARARSRILPLGLLTARSAEDHLDFGVRLNPDREETEAACRGFVAIADNFGAIRAFAEELREPEDATLAAPVEGVRFTGPRSLTVNRMVVCGFRPGTTYLLEDLLRSSPGAEALILVDDEAERDSTLETLAAHGTLVEAGLRRSQGGTFHRGPEGVVFRAADGRVSRVRVHVTDWVASQVMVNLPEGFGPMTDVDLVVFVAERLGQNDPRTTTALLKLEDLCQARGKGPRIVAEVSDARLARRLSKRFRDREGLNLRVFSLEELRALFLFQAVVVPGFDVVYGQLLGSWGQSFLRRGVEPGARGPATFDGLAATLRARGELLVAVVLREGGEEVVRIAPRRGASGDRFDLADLESVWVVGDDQAVPGRMASSLPESADKSA